VIVAKDKRINARHIRDMEAAGMTRVEVSEDYLLGRVLATAVVDPQTGEILANANDELTDEELKKLRAAGVSDIRTVYIKRSGSGCLHLEHAAHRRDRRPAVGAHRDLPDDEAGEPPTETRSKRCSGACFSTTRPTTCRELAA